MTCRLLYFTTAAILLTACSRPGEPAAEASGPPQGSGGAVTAPIDFGKLVGGAPGGDSPAGAAAGEGTYYRVKLTKIMDAQGWEQPVEIARFLLPADWHGQGGAIWDQKAIKCVPNIVQTHFTSASPDGLSGMDVAPPYTWVSSDHPEVAQLLQQSAAQGGCPVAPPMSAIAYLERTVVPRYRAGATVIERQAEPEIAQAKRAAAAALLEGLRAQGGLRDYRFDSASIHIAYRRNGQPVEEWLTTTVMQLATPTSTLSGMQRGAMNDATQISSIAENVIAIRAPQGKFDKELAATILVSLRPNPVYQAAVSKFQQNMNNIALQGVMDRARIWREAAAEISRTINETYRSQQAAQDRMAKSFSQYIRGVAVYTNPATGQPVEVASGYSGVWMGSNGEIILSHNPNFDPGGELGGGWTRLDPSKP